VSGEKQAKKRTMEKRENKRKRRIGKKKEKNTARVSVGSDITAAK